MSTGTLAPAFFFTAFDNNGLMLPGAILNFYQSGTSTPATVYADSALLTPLGTSVTCDASGRAVVYLDAKNYKVIYTTPGGVTMRTVDPVGSVGLVQSGVYLIFNFGGDPTSPITATTYAAGTTFDKCHAGSSIYPVDSATLAPGTYNLQGMLLSSAGNAVSAALVNLSDGNDAVPLVAITTINTLGLNVLSSPITFAAAGSSKNYAIKVKSPSGNAAFAWALQLVKTA
jgi:hypothetical protein